MKKLIRVTWFASDKKTIVAHSFFPDADHAQECVSSLRDCLLSEELEPEDLPLPVGAVPAPGHGDTHFFAEHVSIPASGFVERQMIETFGIAVIPHPLWDEARILPVEAWSEADKAVVHRREQISFLPPDDDMVSAPERPELDSGRDARQPRPPGGLSRHTLH